MFNTSGSDWLVGWRHLTSNSGFHLHCCRGHMCSVHPADGTVAWKQMRCPRPKWMFTAATALLQSVPAFPFHTNTNFTLWQPLLPVNGEALYRGWKGVIMGRYSDLEQAVDKDNRRPHSLRSQMNLFCLPQWIATNVPAYQLRSDTVC